MNDIPRDDHQRPPNQSALKEAYTLASEPNFGYLATTRKDGHPVLTTTWVDVDGADLLVNGVVGRGWVLNLQRDPRITMVIAALSNPYRCATVRGRAAVDTSIDARKHFDRLVLKYRDLPFPDDFDPGERVVMRVSIDAANYRFEPPPGSGTAMNLWLGAR